MTTQIGWELATEQLAIKQGSSGAFNLICTVTNADGSALASYDGWTCRLSFLSPASGHRVIDLAPTVTGDGTAKTLTAAVIFVPGTTGSLAPGLYQGDAKFSMPSPSTDVYFSADLELTVQESAS